MFLVLPESRRHREWQLGGTFSSFVVHAVLISAAVATTAQDATEAEELKPETLVFSELQPQEQQPNEPPPPETPPPDVAVSLQPAKGFQVLAAPVEIPNVIPDVDLTRAVTNEEDFSGKGVAGGVARGVEGGAVTGPVDANQPYFEFQVEKPAITAPGNPAPPYPPALERAGITGEVLVQFVVDTAGVADMSTLKVLRSDNTMFEQSVRRVLPQYRFLPAEIGGRKVKMWVQLPFQFVLGK